MNKKEEYIAIRLSISKKEYKPSNRCLLWCNEHWYETTDEQVYVFPVNKIPLLKQYLAGNYIYLAAFIHEDGTEEIWDYFHKEVVVKPKTSGFTIKIKI